MEIALAVLAVYRLSRMAALEDGPLDVFARWRGFLFQSLGAGHWVTRGFDCPACISFWLSLPVLFFISQAVNPFLEWLAISGGATLLYKLERE